MSAAIQPYTLLDDEDCESRILRAREILGERLVILGHHYQRDEVFRHANFTGDSLKLSKQVLLKSCFATQFIPIPERCWL